MSCDLLSVWIKNFLYLVGILCHKGEGRTVTNTEGGRGNFNGETPCKQKQPGKERECSLTRGSLELLCRPTVRYSAPLFPERWDWVEGWKLGSKAGMGDS